MSWGCRRNSTQFECNIQFHVEETHAEHAHTPDIKAPAQSLTPWPSYCEGTALTISPPCVVHDICSEVPLKTKQQKSSYPPDLYSSVWVKLQKHWIINSHNITLLPTAESYLQLWHPTSTSQWRYIFKVWYNILHTLDIDLVWFRVRIRCGLTWRQWLKLVRSRGTVTSSTLNTPDAAVELYYRQEQSEVLETGCPLDTVFLQKLPSDHVVVCLYQGSSW